MHRIVQYCLNRLMPICLLWGGVAVAALLVPRVATAPLPKDCNCTPTVSLERFVDPDLLVVLFVGVLPALAVLSLIDRFIATSAGHHENMRRGGSRLWDEVSAASTHLAVGTFVVGLLSAKPAPVYALGYLVVGIVTFHVDLADASGAGRVGRRDRA